MKVNIIYPKLAKKKKNSYYFIKLVGIIFILATIISTVINLILQGKPWALIVALGLFIIWKFVLSPSVIDYNPIAQFVSLLSYSCLMLHFIDIFFARGWAITVIPIVLFSGIIFASVLLFTDYETQKHNVFPIFLILLFSIILSIVALSVDYFQTKWVYIVLLSVSVFYLIICTFIVKNNLFKEFRKRLSIK